MQADSQSSERDEVLQLRVLLIPTTENVEQYHIRLENLNTGETQILETLDAFEEHIAAHVAPLIL